MSDSAKFHPNNPTPVLRYAARRAVATGQDQYVRADVDMFRHSNNQPAPNRSHWKIDLEANLFAHLAEPGVNDYHYLPCQGEPD